MTDTLLPDTPVSHPEHGQGRVVVDTGPTVIVRFASSIESVLRELLTVTPSLSHALSNGLLDDSTGTLLRAQALAIRSVNDQWGVFSRSRVQLLPHQLWVCHRVNRSWPFRWLVADDVGLGKTIEAGLVLMPLIASGRVRRLLVLAPAKLVPQWQKRLREMFDIRLQPYARAVDTPQMNFWDTANMVVASIHTLRGEVTDSSRPSAFLEADPWDAVVVDEAHHLNADERMGETLSFQLLRAMEERRKISSLLLFTGTPHRGKDFGFLSLLSLLRPDEFRPDGDLEPQLAKLPEVMIRNNKATATDLRGNLLFTPVTVESREYSFSEDERTFYDTLSHFIVDGRAYASSLDGRAQTARMLVLVTLQKLAASSIAAIRSALLKRREKLAATAGEARALATRSDEEETLDDQAARDERTPFEVLAELMEGEVERLDELIALASPITQEEKIRRLVHLIDGDLPPNEPVLLFTEYKATQALVVDALHARFGHGACAFINGDERLDKIRHEDGTVGAKTWPREAAAEAFNKGDVRFLVSTEAAGEGIDLQERCATLVHVDMPWNPMRLHQRVGRLSRYGQTRPVQVFILRNPATVEARIWDLLNAKLERIQQALSRVMEEREDIGQLVVGMTGASFFEQLFADGQTRDADGLTGWFDRKTATIGGEDVVDRVKAMLGNVARFDFAQVGRNLPKVDLPDLERFFSLMLERSGRRVMKREDGLEVKTPSDWTEADYALQDRYSGLIFDRSANLGRLGATRLVGVGHRLFDTALSHGEKSEGVLARVARLSEPLLVVSVEDEVTGQGSSVNRLVAGATRRDGQVLVLRDWELLQELNGLGRSDAPTANSKIRIDLPALEAELAAAIDGQLPSLAEMMTRPRIRTEILFLPEEAPAAA
ncbi:ERCC4-related helicase [Sphingomonas kaistensis]|uniref:ERCC4-related helicase n=1 Tax=Sphingomonas kaistensis TaxID=298708 RepID=A0A7X5Y616_9SPHN|nr:DEAD/DEAH box helicase [Sphingomonas kaistensis]NJC05776.1 ERCC4-related helicase [Sphingomonas kaistensis]